jgi:hypothetical protein
MNLEAILLRLEKVRKTGPQNWLSRCPSHEDGSPSFTLHATGDGRILAHCFAGCGFPEIVEAVGLGWDAWFPEKTESDYRGGVRGAFPAADVLAALSAEALVVRVAAANVNDLSEADKARLALAQERIAEGVRLANG